MLTLRPFQSEALALLERQARIHLLCISPTGSGKSLIFQEYLRRHVCRAVLITPLRALHQQHFQKLMASGIQTQIGFSDSEWEAPTQSSQVWILSPESLWGQNHKASQWRQVQTFQPDLLIVDEAHTLLEWGKSFRPAFLELHRFKELSSIQKTLWLTATPSPQLGNWIHNHFKGPFAVLGDFAIPDQLQIEAFSCPWVDRGAQLVQRLAPYLQEGHLFFVSTRKQAEQWRQRLQNIYSKTVVTFHSGLSHEEKELTLKTIQTSPAPWMVCTVAFGMGMDFDTFSHMTLLYPLPSLLSIAQAFGRVGRNGRAGTGVLFWSQEDFEMMEWLVQQPWSFSHLQLLEVYHCLGSDTGDLRDKLIRSLTYSQSRVDASS